MYSACSCAGGIFEMTETKEKLVFCLLSIVTSNQRIMMFFGENFLRPDRHWPNVNGTGS